MLSRAWTALGYYDMLFTYFYIESTLSTLLAKSDETRKIHSVWLHSSLALKHLVFEWIARGFFGVSFFLHRCMILGFDSKMTWNVGTLQHQHHSQLIPSCSKNMAHIIFNHLKSSSNLGFFPQFTQFLRLFPRSPQPQPGPTAPRHRCSLHCSVITAMSGVISATAEAMPSMREAEPSWA